MYDTRGGLSLAQANSADSFLVACFFDSLQARAEASFAPGDRRASILPGEDASVLVPMLLQRVFVVLSWPLARIKTKPNQAKTIVEDLNVGVLKLI